MTHTLDAYFKNCLYFSANALAREITRMAEDEFRKLGISTSQAFLLMLVVEHPGISQKELSKHLSLAQSTVSRFVDALVRKHLVTKTAEGRMVHVYPTQAGADQLVQIHQAWSALYARYSRILGKRVGDRLTRDAHDAFTQLRRQA